jgi:hypothetical protein
VVGDQLGLDKNKMLEREEKFQVGLFGEKFYVPSKGHRCARNLCEKETLHHSTYTPCTIEIKGTISHTIQYNQFSRTEVFWPCLFFGVANVLRFSQVFVRVDVEDVRVSGSLKEKIRNCDQEV